MDPLQNPFSPGAGSPPPELAGRGPLLAQTAIVLGRIKQGKSEKSRIFVGLRGVGKTVLLNKIKEQAVALGYKIIFLEAHEDKSLAALLLPSLRQILFELDRMENVSQKVKRGFRILRSFVNGIKIK